VIALIAGVLGASLIGSVHCAGMCGGLVGVYAADPVARAGWRRGLEHAAYNAGRLAAYALLGASAGALGASADLAGALAGIGRIAAVAAGSCVALWGAVSLADALGIAGRRAGAPHWLRVAAGRAVRLVARRDLVARAATLGLVTGLMPCGWLYAFVLAAAGTASPAAGAGLMLVFWAGTVPMMAGLGLGLRALAAPLRRYVPVAGAIAMIAVGLMTVSGRAAPAPGPSPTASAERVHGDR
jgi:sulfite exporter TauE/SafE